MSAVEETRTIVMEAAAAMAAKMGMNAEEDMTTLWEGQQVMMATSAGIVIGKIRVAHVEKRTARFDTYLMTDTILSPGQFSEVALCQYRFYAREDGNGVWNWEEEPDIICSLPEGAVLFVQ